MYSYTLMYMYVVYTNFECRTAKWRQETKKIGDYTVNALRSQAGKRRLRRGEVFRRLQVQALQVFVGVGLPIAITARSAAWRCER